MIRLLIRLCISALAVIVIDLLILLPLVLAIVDVIPSLRPGIDLHEQMDIVEGMGVILIGWGVALEERGALREIFRLAGTPGEARQVAIDHACHTAGIGLLIFGLFAEICVEILRLPPHIIDVRGFDEYVLGLSLAFLVFCVWIMIRHGVALAVAAFGGGRAGASRQTGHH